jgi:predicted transcriptional regulator
MDLPAEQARKLAVLKSLVEEGMADVEAGRVVPWDLEEFLKRAHEQLNRTK